MSACCVLGSRPGSGNSETRPHSLASLSIGVLSLSGLQSRREGSISVCRGQGACTHKGGRPGRQRRARLRQGAEPDLPACLLRAPAELGGLPWTGIRMHGGRGPQSSWRAFPSCLSLDNHPVSCRTTAASSTACDSLPTGTDLPQPVPTAR